MSWLQWWKQPEREWIHLNKVVNPPSWDFDTCYYEYRLCVLTGLLERMEPHCLGLNPPEYTFHWEPIKGKPVLLRDSQGQWRLVDVR